MSYHDMVEKLARDEFGAKQVTRVDVELGEGWGGGSTIDITILLDLAVSQFDADKAAAFKQDLRAKLNAEDDDGHPTPVVSFVPTRREAA